MIEKKDELFCIKEVNVNKLIKDLKKWNVEATKNDSYITFELQSNCTVYNVTLVIKESNMQRAETLEEVESFNDIQMKVLGKIIWNWR